MTDQERLDEALRRAAELILQMRSRYGSSFSEQGQWLVGWLDAIRVLIGNHGHGHSNWHDVGDDGCRATATFIRAMLGEEKSA